jgi:hypothetical protein
MPALTPAERQQRDPGIVDGGHASGLYHTAL